MQPTPTHTVDVAVIGAGTAGQSAFHQVKKCGKNVVIINAGSWTTTCVDAGCMPSKLLLAAAERAHLAHTADEFGVITQVQIDGKAVMQRVQRERARLASYVQTTVDGWDDDQKISGTARIVGKNADDQTLLAVNDDIIAADTLIIATGSTPSVPDGWADILSDRLLTSDTVFDLPDLPKSLAVVGAGAIGLELAQAFSLLGVRVRLFNRDATLGSLSDDDINAAAIDSLATTMDMALNVTIDTLTRTDNGVCVHYTDCDGNAQTFEAEYLLAAVGRHAELENLGIDKLDIALDDKGYPKDLDPATGQIGKRRMFVAGDASGHFPLLHIANIEGTQAGMLTKDCPITVDYIRDLPVPLSVVFCLPNIAQIGQTYAQLKDSDTDFVTGKVSFANQGRSRVMGVNQGALHIYAHRSDGKLLGASMVAPDGEYLAHILALAIMQRLSASELLTMPFYHPTIIEGMRTALRDIVKQCLALSDDEGTDTAAARAAETKNAALPNVNPMLR